MTQAESATSLLVLAPTRRGDAVKRGLAGLARRVPLDRLREAAGVRTIVPYYHMVNDEPVPHVRHLYSFKSVEEFQADLSVLLKHFRPVGLIDILTAVKRGLTLPPGGFHLTFDDGFSEMAEVVAPILHKMGISATFFVATDFIDNRELCYEHKASLIVDRLNGGVSERLHLEVLYKLLASARDLLPEPAIAAKEGVNRLILGIPYERRELLDEIAELLELDFSHYLRARSPYLTTAQIKGLVRQGFTIGAHSLDHPIYQRMTLQEQLVETKASLQEVRQRFGLDYGAFAFPHSDRRISRRFYEEIAASGLADLCFGTSDLREDSVGFSIQRFSLEKNRLPVDRFLSLLFARKVVRRLGGRDRIARAS